MNTVIWQPLKGLKTCVPFTPNSLNLMTLRHKPTLSLSLVFLIAFVLFPVYQLFPTHLFSSIPYLFIKNTFRAWRHYKKEWGRTIERSAASKEKKTTRHFARQSRNRGCRLCWRLWREGGSMRRLFYPEQKSRYIILYDKMVEPLCSYDRSLLICNEEDETGRPWNRRYNNILCEKN